MKTRTSILLTSLVLLGCKKVCPEGTIVAINSSLETVQRVKIDNVVYAILYPGESMDVDVPEGTHQLTFEDANNSNRGCEPITVHLKPCGTETRTCNN